MPLQPHQIQTPKPYIHLLDQCTTLLQFKQIHSLLTTTGLLLTHPFLITKLIQTLTTTTTTTTALNSFSLALQILSQSAHAPTLLAYNTLLKSLSSSKTPHRALHLFAEIPHPNSSSFTFALKACARTHALSTTKAIHALSITCSHQSSAHVANTALHAYASSGDLSSARRLFDAHPLPLDTIRWNAMLTGYAHNGLPLQAVTLFHQMWAAGIAPTDVSVITALSACAQLMALPLGTQIHGFVSKKTMLFDREINVGTALLDMYAKCGRSDSAQRVFDGMRRRDTGAWNALIGGYVLNSQFQRAIQCFDGLVLSEFCPDEPTFVSTLCACAHLGALDTGRRIHELLEERGHHLDATLGTCLIEMYAKCGCVEVSSQVFDRMPKKDGMAWTSMIGALAAHGHAHDALELFDLMRKHGHQPDGVTFVGVLSACRHGGLIEEGLSYFELMKKRYRIKPRVEHCGCMIDLFSRAGRLKDALDIIVSMEVGANPIIWRSFLSACRLNLDVEMAEIAVENLRKMGSGHCGDYVLLSNIYALKGRWDDARRVRSLMNEAEIKKKPAFSLVE